MAVYLVKVNPASPFERLVNAKTRAQAVAHVIDGAVTVYVPTPQEMLALGKAGAVIEEAGETVEPVAKLAAQ